MCIQTKPADDSFIALAKWGTTHNQIAVIADVSGIHHSGRHEDGPKKATSPSLHRAPRETIDLTVL